MEQSCPDVIDCIAEDHESLKNVMQRLQSDELDTRRKRIIFKRFLPLFEAHTFAEEHTVMERALQTEETRPLSLKGLEEHELIAIQLKRLALAADDEQWHARLKVFCGLVESHLKEEAARTLPAFRSVFSEQARQELGMAYVEARNRHQLGPVFTLQPKAGERLLETAV